MNKNFTNSLLLSMLSMGVFAQEQSVKGEEVKDLTPTQKEIIPVDYKDVIRYGTYDLGKAYYYELLKEKDNYDSGNTYYEMGRIMLSEQKNDSADYFFQKGLRTSWDYEINNLGIAKLSLMKGSKKEANSKLNSLIARTSEPTADLYIDIANVYLDDPNGDVEKAKEYAEKAKELDSSNVMAHLAVGDAYLKEGQNKIAEVIYRKTMKAFPDSVEPKLRLAKIYKNYNLFGDAIEVLNKAIEQAPEHPAAYRDLALVYQDYADFSNNDSYLKKASENYTKFYELFPHSYDMDNQYADFLVDIEDFDKLTDWLGQKWVERGDNFLIYRFASVSAYELGNKNQAYLYEKKYFDVQKDNPEKITAVDNFYLGLGEVAQSFSFKEFNKELFENGIEHIKKGITENPKLANRIYRNALPLFKQGKYEQAYYLFNQGTRFDTTKYYIENLYYKATCLFQIADRGIVSNPLNEATKALDEVIKLSPNSVEAYLMNARVNREINTPSSLEKMKENYRLYLEKVRENGLQNEASIQNTLAEAEKYLK